jgi:hypothetical protein
MKNFLLSTVLLLPAVAQAHPGHGRPGFLHSHSLSELENWVANGALLLYAVVVLGIACWGLTRAWSHFRKKARRDDPR